MISAWLGRPGRNSDVFGSEIRAPRARLERVGEMTRAQFVAATLIVCFGGCWTAAEAASPYTVGNYPVDATANDAVAAKTQGMLDAKKGAFRYLLKRLVAVDAYRRLPELPLPAIEDLLEDVSVRSEQNSPTEYVASLDFGFRAGAVRQLLASQGLPYLDKPAPVLTIIPAFAVPEGGKPISLQAGQLAWRQAWTSLDLVHSLTPVKLAVAGPSSTNDTFLKLGAGDRSKLGVVQAESSAGKLLLAIASPSADGSKLTVTLIGEDWAGPIELRRTYRLYFKDLAYTSEFATVIALGVLEGRWKMSQGVSGAGAETVAATGWVPAGDAPGGAPQPVRFTAEFDSLQQWQQIRSRLGQLAGPENLQVGALSSRGAEVTLGFPGGPDALQQRLASEGMTLFDAGGHLVLRAAN